MAGIFGSNINGRTDFFRELSRGHRLVDSLLLHRRGDTTLAAVKTQIEAIENWTANGRQPAPDERQRIGMGYRMYREFDGDPDPQIQELRQLAMELNNYFQYWPDDMDARDPNNKFLVLRV